MTIDTDYTLTYYPLGMVEDMECHGCSCELEDDKVEIIGKYVYCDDCAKEMEQRNPIFSPRPITTDDDP